MADGQFHIEIITPEKVVVSDDIDTMEAPGISGEFQVLADHTPFLSGLRVGAVIYTKSGKKTAVSISGGFCEVQPAKTVILAHTAEPAGNIDVKRAKEAHNRAKQRLDTPGKEIDIERAEAALARAMNRLKVAELH